MERTYYPFLRLKSADSTRMQILRSAHLWWFVRHGHRQLGVKLMQSLCCPLCADPMPKSCV